MSGVLFRETAFSVTCRLSTGPKEVESLSEFREDSGRLGNYTAVDSDIVNNCCVIFR